jgi:hypothetical protein
MVASPESSFTCTHPRRSASGSSTSNQPVVWLVIRTFFPRAIRPRRPRTGRRRLQYVGPSTTTYIQVALAGAPSEVAEDAAGSAASSPRDDKKTVIVRRTEQTRSRMERRCSHVSVWACC